MFWLFIYIKWKINFINNIKLFILNLKMESHCFYDTLKLLAYRHYESFHDSNLTYRINLAKQILFNLGNMTEIENFEPTETFLFLKIHKSFFNDKPILFTKLSK